MRDQKESSFETKVWTTKMDAPRGQLIFNREEIIVTKTTSKIKAVSSCLVKYVFIVNLFATMDCAYKIDKDSKRL